MAIFNQSVQLVLLVEGGFAPSDANRGAVKYGINQQTLREHGYPHSVEDVRNMTQKFAEQFYFKHFWLKTRTREISHQVVADLFFTTFINMNPLKAGRILQLATDGMAEVDGKVGPKTINAVNSIPPAEFVPKFLAELEVYYRNRAAEHGDEKHLPGWLNRVRTMRKWAKDRM